MGILDKEYNDKGKEDLEMNFQINMIPCKGKPVVVKVYRNFPKNSSTPT